MMALYIVIPIAALLVILGCMIRFKKAHWLIAGYNTMPPEKQANVDIQKIGKVVSTCLFVCAALVAAGGICLYLSLGLPGFICLLAILPICLTAVALTGKHDHNPADQKSRLRIIIPTAIVVVVLFIVFNMMLSGSQPTQYSLSNGALTISTMYGETVNFSDFKSVELKDTVPDNLYKTDGFDLSTVLKGHFKSGSTDYTLFVDTAKPPFIYLDTTSGAIILNDQSADQTKALYDKLKAVVK